MFSIESRSMVPIFEQIYNQVRKYIALNILKPKEQLPTVRSLARELGVNPNTISKAYSLCETNKLIESIPGLGYFVLDNEEGIEIAKRDLFEKLHSVVDELCDMGVTVDEIISHSKGGCHDTTHKC